MHLLIWSLLLLLVGLALIVLEVFIPSGGILGLLAAVALVAAIGIGFFAGPLIGVAVLAAAVFAVPAIIAAALRIWPSTPMGRRILLGVPSEQDVLPDNRELRELKQLVGQVGVVKSMMLPSGKVQVAGRAVDAIAQGIAIDPGQHVEIVEVRGTRVFVRPVDENVALTPAEGPKQPANPLDRPIEALGIEDPLLGNQT